MNMFQESDQRKAINTIITRFFSDEDMWERSKFLCVNEDKEDAARRALVYCQWDLDEASKIINENLTWREKENIDSILLHSIPRPHLLAIRGAMGDGFFGLDYDGYPIYWCPAGLVDLASLKEKVPLEEIVRYHVQIMEYNQQVYLRDISLKADRTIHSVTCVVDLKHFGPRNLNKSFRECVKIISNIDRDFYYDNARRVIILNAPIVFRLFWRTFSSLFRKENKDKFIFLETPAYLNRYIDPTITPKSFGGEYDGDDALCTKESPFSSHSESMDSYIEELRLIKTTEFKVDI